MTAEPIQQRNLEGEAAFESERCVLCACMLSRDDLLLATAHLEPKMFGALFHRTIFSALMRIRDANLQPSLLTCAAQLEAAGELAQAGGRAELASIMEMAGARENHADRIRAVREAFARRERRRLALELSQADAAHQDSLLEQIAALKSLAEPLDGPLPLAAQVLDSRQLIDARLTPVESLIGKGLIVKGGLTLIVGQSGLGKTYLALQVMRSLATGSQWLGYDVKVARSCLVELEMPAASIRDRLRAGVAEEESLKRMDWLIMPVGMGPVTDPRTVDQLSILAEKRKIEFLAFDPLHAIHNGDENEALAVDALLSSVQLISSRTGCSIALIHHVNKIEIDDKGGLKSAVLRSVRGSGRLVNDPDTVLGLIERRGRTELVFAKTRHAAPVREVAIHQAENGYFELSQTPEQQADKSIERIEKALFFAGKTGMLIDDLARTTELSKRTIESRLREVHVVTVTEPGRGKRIRYFAPGMLEEQGEVPF